MAFESVHTAPRFYTFKEVVSICEIKPYVLRFWESEFCEIKPTHLPDGSKQYRQSDIDFIIKVKDLLFNQKMSIPEAKSHVSRSQLEESFQANMDLKVEETPTVQEEILPVEAPSFEESVELATVETELVDYSQLSENLHHMLNKIDEISQKHSWNI